MNISDRAKAILDAVIGKIKQKEILAADGGNIRFVVEVPLTELGWKRNHGDELQEAMQVVNAALHSGTPGNVPSYRLSLDKNPQGVPMGYRISFSSEAELKTFYRQYEQARENIPTYAEARANARQSEVA